MSADLGEHVTDPSRARPDAAGVVAVPARAHRRRGLLLVAIGLWNVWLWVTRAWNLAQDPTPRTDAFIAVHAVLYVVSFGFALVLLTLGARALREARAAR
ncbi:MAG: SCO4848 family membrane protein [Actinomycetes bacterium]